MSDVCSTASSRLIESAHGRHHPHESTPSDSTNACNGCRTVRSCPFGVIEPIRSRTRPEVHARYDRLQGAWSGVLQSVSTKSIHSEQHRELHDAHRSASSSCIRRARAGPTLRRRRQDARRAQLVYLLVGQAEVYDSSRPKMPTRNLGLIGVRALARSWSAWPASSIPSRGASEHPLDDPRTREEGRP